MAQTYVLKLLSCTQLYHNQISPKQLKFGVQAYFNTARRNTIINLAMHPFPKSHKAKISHPQIVGHLDFRTNKE